MALNIKNKVVEELATEVSRMAGETKTEAIRRALVKRKAELEAGVEKPDRKKRLLEYFQREVWPHMPPEELGRVLTREEENDILGYGPNGY
jgi:antitoxin VapB